MSCELRALTLSDDEIRSFTDSVNANLTTRHLFTGTYPKTYGEMKAQWEREKEVGDVLFGIWSGEDFIGVCGLHAPKPIYRSWELRIIIHDPSALGKGIGTEATALLTDYAFNRLNAHRVWLGVNVENEAAVKCYRKVGYREEGRLRDEIYSHGSYRDVFRMSILEHEWRTRRSLSGLEGSERDTTGPNILTSIATPTPISLSEPE